VHSVLNLHVPGDAGKPSSGLTTEGLSSSAQLHGVNVTSKRNAKYHWKCIESRTRGEIRNESSNYFPFNKAIT
jgi:hypothetical protein